jgi:nucleotide-binding universal stress UspA family protein
MIDLNRILCPVDFSEFSEHALAFAMRMAKWYGAALHVLHVIPPVSLSEPNELARVSRSLTQRNLTGIIARNRIPAIAITNEIVESPDAATAILECANQIDADLIVTGSHGRTGIHRTLLGSVVETLLHRSNRPMLTIPSHIDPQRVTRGLTFNRVLCAVDFSGASLAGLAYAFSIAEECNAKLTLLHVIELPPELQYTTTPGEFDVAEVRAAAEAERRRQLSALVPEHARDFCTIETAVLEGSASRQILGMSDAMDVDLIVLGVHGRNAFDLAFFGSNSKDVIRQAHCPVLVVPVSRRSALKAAS